MTKKRAVLAQQTASLKSHPAYVAAREAKLAQFAVEDPDCYWIECIDCCYTVRLEKPYSWGNHPDDCPECGGTLRSHVMRGGQIA